MEKNVLENRRLKLTSKKGKPLRHETSKSVDSFESSTFCIQSIGKFSCDVKFIFIMKMPTTVGTKRLLRQFLSDYVAYSIIV